MSRTDQGAKCQEKALLISTKLLEFGAAATVEFHSDGKNFSVLASAFTGGSRV